MSTNCTTSADVTLGEVIVFSLEPISLWSGRRRLKREDIRAKDAELPPADIASMGSKKVIDPEEISDFEALKKEAHRECAKVGIRFLGGYAVPNAEAGTLAKALDDIGARFAARKAQFLADYDTKVSDWVAAHPEWSEMLQEAALNRQEVEGKLSYGYSAFRVSTAADTEDADDVLEKGLNTEIGGLAKTLYAEIAQAAGTVMEKSLLGRDKVTQKILSPIRTIRKKLFGLAFLDARVKPLIETIDHILAQLPPAGHIDGMALTALHGLIFILSSEQRMQEHGDLIVAGKTVDEATKVSIPALVEPEEEPEVESIFTPEDLAVAPVAPAPQSDLFQQAGAPAPAAHTPSVQGSPLLGGLVPGMGVAMAPANFAARKIIAPPPVQRRI